MGKLHNLLLSAVKTTPHPPTLRSIELKHEVHWLVVERMIRSGPFQPAEAVAPPKTDRHTHLSFYWLCTLRSSLEMNEVTVDGEREREREREKRRTLPDQCTNTK